MLLLAILFWIFASLLLLGDQGSCHIFSFLRILRCTFFSLFSPFFLLTFGELVIVINFLFFFSFLDVPRGRESQAARCTERLREQSGRCMQCSIKICIFQLKDIKVLLGCVLHSYTHMEGVMCKRERVMFKRVREYISAKC
jgi:hypothetical protein